MDKVTFSDLINHHISSHNKTADKQTLLNERTALNKFMGYHNFSLATSIPVWFADEGNFNLKVEEYLSNSGLSEKTIAPRRAMIKKFRKSYQEMIVAVRAPKDFVEALNYYIEQSGMSARAIARKAGVKKNRICDWANGAQYPDKPYSAEKVYKVEKALDLTPGSLVSLLPSLRKKKHIMGATPYSKQLSINSKKKYRLRKPAWTEKCQTQFSAYCAFKLDDDIAQKGIIKHRMSGWRKDDPEVGTRQIHESLFTELWGYLLLPKASAREKDPDLTVHGQGMLPEELGMENLLNSDLVEGFLKFHKARSGSYNSMSLNFIAVASSAVNPVHGFIVQHPDLFSGIGNLKTLCAEAHGRYKEIYGQLENKKLIKKTRDPLGMCLDILAHPRPLDILLKLGKAAQDSAEKRWGGRKLCKLAAVDYRNSLIVNFLPRIPLRRKNYVRMTWRADNSGHLRKKADGTWWLSIPKEEFKNVKGAAGDRDFDVPIRPELVPLVEYYIYQCRPVLLGGNKSDYIFLSRAEKPFSLNNFSNLVADMTHSFSSIPTPGFRPHCYRHLVATHYLRLSPENVEVVAQVLHDRPETVRKEYAHLLVKDGYDLYSKHIDQILAEQEEENDGVQKGLPTLSAEQILRAFGKLSPAERKRVMAEVVNG